MGENLSLNIASKGFEVSVYNRTPERTQRFAARLEPHIRIKPTYSVSQLISTLEKPRRIILMVKAGKAVEDVLHQLRSSLSSGDMVFDCGNSHFRDTERRQSEVSILGLRFMGVGVSGGEEGALKGPCIMAGGPPEAYDQSRELWNAISAKVDGESCAAYVGFGGAGHFVKMVHNGIEYAMLQLIAECYDILTRGLGLGLSEVRNNFEEWSKGALNSFLLEAAVDVLGTVDEETGRPLLDLVVDRAEQKGTGVWASQTAHELGIPTPSIDAAVSARHLSALKEMRVQASKLYGRQPVAQSVGVDSLVEQLRDAYWATAIVCYAQGLSLIAAGSERFKYGTELSGVVRIWRGGCIIRARLLNELLEPLERADRPSNVLMDESLASRLLGLEPAWRSVLQECKSRDIPTPVLDASLNYFTALRRETLPAKIIQAMRDRFGAHTFERVDRPGRFHSSWRPGQ